jgi:hypothetical protein
MLLYPLIVFFSALFLFQVELLLGKRITPIFGGTPAAWLTALLFFQVMLMAGYALAAWLQRLDLRKQRVVYLSLLGISTVALFLSGLSYGSSLFPQIIKFRGLNDPQGQILWMLLASIGLPFLVLATNSPLMQAWFGLVQPGRSPYPLYALSNFGSLLGLLAYPFAVEPLLTLRMQALVWTAGYVLLVAAAGIVAFKLKARHTSSKAEFGGTAKITRGETVRLGERILWIALSAVGSILLLAVTNHLTTEITVVPFLWVLPLAVYLLTFILVFASDKIYARFPYTGLLFGATILFAWVYYYEPVTLSTWAYILAFVLVQFLATMVVHGELADRKPAPERLTDFYLMISVGGALGSLLVSVVAPLVFHDMWELPIGLLLAWLCLLAVNGLEATPGERGWGHRLAELGMVSGLAVTGVVLLMAVSVRSQATAYADRSFYGVVRVRELYAGDPAEQRFVLVHGATIHGYQFTDPARRELPTAYYTENSGIGLAILNHPNRAQGLRIGDVGLGVGTLAAFGRQNDSIRFYEINPDVIQLAQGLGGYFDYVTASPARTMIVPGDARLSLERELAADGSNQFDILSLDAFSDSAMPVHLMTEEAWQVYLAHLKPDGILAINISTHALDLRPVVKALADHFGLSAVIVQDQGDGERAFWSTWMLVTRNQAFLQQPQVAARIKSTHDLPPVRLWTDDYSNILQVIDLR